LYGIEARGLTLRDGYRESLVENSRSREIFRPKMEEVIDNCILRSCMVYKPRQILIREHIIEIEVGGVCGRQKWIKAPVGKKVRKRDHLEDLRAYGMIILKWIFKAWEKRAWIGFIRLGIGTSCGLLQIW
jgi:hypothetical protein